MRKFSRVILILISIALLSLTASFVFAYIYLYDYTEIEINHDLIECEVKNERSKLFAYSNKYAKGAESESVPYAYLSDGKKYKRAKIEDVPSNLTFAFVAIEDKNFYRHSGVDFIRSARATINYGLFKKSSFGASTITQQLVKNLTGNDEISAKRKINEIFMALDMEKKYTKDEIMEMYLNIINLGNGCRGVGAAAEYYFSKDVDKLTLCECATIAAITNNPSYYNPEKNPENNKKRRDIILLCMKDQGYISEAEYYDAIGNDVLLNINKGESEEINSWYTDMVIEDVIDDLCANYSISRYVASNMIYSGGLNIYTAIDKSIQKILEDYYADKSHFLFEESGISSAFTVIDSSSGDILGVVGNIGDKTQNRLQSYATDTKRPTGSAIKPLSVYAPAIDEGIIKWSSIYEDSPIKIGNSDWPKNANGKYIGNVDIATALKKSLNTVPVKILNELGTKKSISFLKEKLCITGLEYSDGRNTHDEGYASLALGQHENGITLMELTGAYIIFSDGEYIKPRSYYKVTDSYGNVLLDNTSEGERVISRESAAIMTKLLEGVVDGGTAKNSISLDNYVSVAGKTGTTQNNADRYFIGYTPSLLGGAWMGYEYPKSIEDGGINPTLKIWDDIMSKIYELDSFFYADTDFEIPIGVKKLSYDISTGELVDENSIKENIRDGWFSE